VRSRGEYGADPLPLVLRTAQAVSESLPVKQAIFGSLATHLPPHAILASNTSSISLSTLAASAVNSKTGENRARQVVGFHFCACRSFSSAAASLLIIMASEGVEGVGGRATASAPLSARADPSSFRA